MTDNLSRGNAPRCETCGAPLVPKPALADESDLLVCPNFHPHLNNGLLEAFGVDLELEHTQAPGPANRFRRLLRGHEDGEAGEVPESMLQDLPEEAKALLQKLRRPQDD